MEQIISDFEGFMGKYGQYYHEFYVGVATDPKDRLVRGHNIQGVPHIYSLNAMGADIVRAIEKFFLNKGAKGGPGGGDNNTQYVYAYKIAPHTIE
jgi:hypothetical protein